jgi:hypothetical protein
MLTNACSNAPGTGETLTSVVVSARRLSSALTRRRPTPATKALISSSFISGRFARTAAAASVSSVTSSSGARLVRGAVL